MCKKLVSHDCPVLLSHLKTKTRSRHLLSIPRPKYWSWPNFLEARQRLKLNITDWYLWLETIRNENVFHFEVGVYQRPISSRVQIIHAKSNATRHEQLPRPRNLHFDKYNDFYTETATVTNSLCSDWFTVPTLLRLQNLRTFKDFSRTFHRPFYDNYTHSETLQSLLVKSTCTHCFTQQCYRFLTLTNNNIESRVAAVHVYVRKLPL